MSHRLQTASRVAGRVFNISLAALAIAMGLGFLGLRCVDPSATARSQQFSVYENRRAGSGRRIQLNVVVNATDATMAREPIFYLAGGPGQAATDLTLFVMGGVFGELAENRDIVLADQRGTGGSNALPCPPSNEPQAYFGHLFSPEWVQACRASLESRADLTQYTTGLAVEDLDEIRAGLGYAKIVLWGTSYGTRLATEYMRRHSDRVAAAVLDGVVAIGPDGPPHYSFHSQHALDRVFEDCAADAACFSAFPDLHHSLEIILSLLRRSPRPAQIRVARTTAPVTVNYSLGDFGYTVRGMLYDPDQVAELPNRLTLAAESGNFDAFAQAYYDRAVYFERTLAHGLYLSVMCSEDVRPVTAAELARWTEGTFLGDYLAREYEAACSLWPRGSVPADFSSPLQSAIPTLLFSGGRDPTTPPSDAETLAHGLSNSLHVVFPRGGHGVAQSPCAEGIARAFLDRYSVQGIDTSCAQN